jgi:hypothetical protein
MAKNDIVLLDGILDERVREGLPSQQSDEVFEYLSFEQILKDYDLSREEIEAGWVDGRDDGGVDGLFTIVNGHLLRDPSTFAWPKRSATLDVVLITAKHHATFQQAPLNNLLATLPELFDLGREKADLKGAYSAALLKARNLFHLAYRRLAAITPAVAFRFVYASRGDSSQVGKTSRPGLRKLWNSRSPYSVLQAPRLSLSERQNSCRCIGARRLSPCRFLSSNIYRALATDTYS